MDVCTTISWDTASWCGSKSCEKRYFLFSLAFSDYKRLDTSLCFIITNVHTELKPQANVSHGMNSPAFTLHTTLIMDNRLTILL